MSQNFRNFVVPGWFCCFCGCPCGAPRHLPLCWGDVRKHIGGGGGVRRHHEQVAGNGGQPGRGNNHPWNRVDYNHYSISTWTTIISEVLLGFLLGFFGGGYWGFPKFIHTFSLAAFCAAFILSTTSTCQSSYPSFHLLFFCVVSVCFLGLFPYREVHSLLASTQVSPCYPTLFQTFVNIHPSYIDNTKNPTPIILTWNPSKSLSNPPS